MNQHIKNTKRFNYISAIFACLLWGSWSFYINYSLGSLKNGVISGIAQGICSFLITLFMTYFIEFQFNYYKNKWLTLIMPPLCTVALTGTGLIIVHYLIGTPNILKTVSPALIIATIFAFFTNFKLNQQKKFINLKNRIMTIYN